MINISSVCH